MLLETVGAKDVWVTLVDQVWVTRGSLKQEAGGEYLGVNTCTVTTIDTSAGETLPIPQPLPPSPPWGPETD